MAVGLPVNKLGAENGQTGQPGCEKGCAASNPLKESNMEQRTNPPLTLHIHFCPEVRFEMAQNSKSPLPARGEGCQLPGSPANRKQKELELCQSPLGAELRSLIVGVARLDSDSCIRGSCSKSLCLQ